MELLSQAEKALTRNWRTVLVYLIVTVAVTAMHGLVMTELDVAVPEEVTAKPLWFVLSSLGMDMTWVLVTAALQAIAFSALGREMDRPLWKCDGWQDSLKRFFSFWLIVNLLMITSSSLVGSVPESMQQDVASVIILFRYALIVVSIPIGACIMHGGGLHWNDVPKLLAPIVHMFPMSFVAFGIGFMQCFIIDMTLASLSKEVLQSPWLWSTVNVPLALLECLAFAAMWLVCMHYREVASQLGNDDDDFDF